MLTFVFFTTCVLHADGFLSSIFGGGKKDTQFTFRTFFEGDWKLQKKTAVIDFKSNDNDDRKSDDTDDEDDEFGDLGHEQGEDGIAPFVVAFYSLRSDNLTNALVGRYYEEEFISKERTRQLNSMKLRIRYDSSGNSGSFLTGENKINDHTNSEDDGEFDDFNVVDDDVEDGGINSNMATLFDFDFKTLPALLSEGNKKAPADIYISEGYWHGDMENSWYQFIITRPDQFILTVHPMASSNDSRQASVTIIGTKYFGTGAVTTPSFFQKYFPTMMIVVMMILRHAIKPNPAMHPGARPPMQPPSATAGMKEPTKENQ